MQIIKRKIVASIFAVGLFATALTVSPALSATATKTPPLERYTCYQIYAPSLTYTYMGYFVLQPGKKYAWGFGKAEPSGCGRYTFDAKGLRFVDGPLKNIRGKFETKANGRHLLELKIQGKKLYPSDDGILTWYANCDAHDPSKKSN